MRQLSAGECGRGMLTIFRQMTMESQAVLQTICPTEVVPSNCPEVAHSLHVLPTVVDWMQRSAYRRGATCGLALG